jgi:AraC family transcriptional regulator of adaptative response/methylated-DNA-[protein]-cysteine methyltransferase
MDANDLDYARVERAIRFLDEHFREQPRLAEVAAAVGMSEYHFQRLFRRWAGVSPKRFLQFLTADYARGLLRDSSTALETALEAGLSGPGRLHDLMVSVDAATPGEIRSGGEGVVVRHGVHPSPFGPALLAATERGICSLSFLEGADDPRPLEALRAGWPGARLVENVGATAPLARRAFARAAGEGRLPLHLRGTNFQIRVWEALLRVPEGAVVTYESLAAAAGAPGAARAVGAAVGANPVAYVIPCHRVIRKTGAFGGYRWGTARKRALLGWEAARAGALEAGAIAV